MFHPVERVIYRVCGVDERGEQRWTTYAYSLLAFSLVSLLVLYAQLRLQEHLPFNPDHQKGVGPALSFNTSVSFLTNTNWQNYSGESTMAHLSQMAGLAVHNFVSAAAGMAVAIALIRGLVSRRTHTLGNFWVDMTRTVVRVLIPIAFVFALILVSQGVVQNFHAAKPVTTVAGQTQTIPGGPIASQEAIKELGENGGGPYNANSAHPFENPNPLTNVLEIWMLLMIPFALPITFGKMAGDRKQGYPVLTAMVALWIATSFVAMAFEAGGNHKLDALGVNQKASTAQSGGNLEGKEVRFGPTASGLFAASTTGTSTGSVNSAHDSFTPLGGAAPLVNMMFGEVDPGGTGSGLYGMLIFALLVGVHRRAHGRANAGVPRQEDPERRDEARRALHPLRAGRRARLHRDLARDAERTALTGQPGTARPHRDDLRVHLRVEQQRLRVRRPHRKHAMVQHDARGCACSSVVSC